MCPPLSVKTTSTPSRLSIFATSSPPCRITSSIALPPSASESLVALSLVALQRITWRHVASHAITGLLQRPPEPLATGRRPDAPTVAPDWPAATKPPCAGSDPSPRRRTLRRTSRRRTPSSRRGFNRQLAHFTTLQRPCTPSYP